MPGGPGVKTSILATLLLWAACSQEQGAGAGPGQRAASDIEVSGGRDAPTQNLVSNGGFEGPDGWVMVGAAVVGSTAVLSAEPGAPVSRLVQRIVALDARSSYVLCLRARVEQAPDHDLVVELTGDNYGGPKRRLRVRPDQLGPTFQTYAKLVPSEQPPEKIRLRILSRSTAPVVVDDVSLTKRG
jgi:hypothetical protein